MAYTPTHDVPPGGLPAWSEPDPSQPPVTTLAGGLDVELVEMRGQWARVACSNGWEGWVDGARLAPPPAPVTPEPEPAPVIPEPEPVEYASPPPEPVEYAAPPPEPVEYAAPPPEPTPPASLEPMAPPPSLQPPPQPVVPPPPPAFVATHVAPEGGIQAWLDPDPSQGAVATLAPGTELVVVEERGQWARVEASNGWSGWVDGARLVRRS